VRNMRSSPAQGDAVPAGLTEARPALRAGLALGFSPLWRVLFQGLSAAAEKTRHPSRPSPRPADSTARQPGPSKGAQKPPPPPVPPRRLAGPGPLARTLRFTPWASACV
jgi:hypothetical protein